MCFRGKKIRGRQVINHRGLTSDSSVLRANQISLLSTLFETLHTRWCHWQSQVRVLENTWFGVEVCVSAV